MDDLSFIAEDWQEPVLFPSRQSARFHIVVSGGSGTRVILYASPTGSVVFSSQNWLSSRFPQLTPGASFEYIKDENTTESLEGLSDEKFQFTNPFLATHNGSVENFEYSQHGVSQETEAFLGRVSDLAKEDESGRAIDFIFQHMNGLLMERRFDDCDEILSNVDLERVPPVLMTAFLTITAAARKSLRNRPAFFANVRRLVEAKRGPEGANRLLVGLS